MTERSRGNEIRLTRVYDAPLRAVWDAWTDPDQVAAWWGPRGFTLTTHSKDLRSGGTWRYTMHGPDGVDYPNVTRYLEVEPLRRLVYDHGGTDDRPALFRVTVTFSERRGRTTMEMTSTLPTPEAAAAMARFIHQAGGNATWDRLAEHLDGRANGRPSFVVHRAFEAPVARLVAHWSEAALRARWSPPLDAPHLALRPTDGEAGETCFAVEGGADDARTTVRFTDAAHDGARVRVWQAPRDGATEAELAAFAGARAERSLRWRASFDALDDLLASAGP
ncbi:MAG: SRPBCC domain-containing protein [Polyangiales bacterium]